MYTTKVTRLLALMWAILVGIVLTLPGDSISRSSRLLPFLPPAWMDKVVHFVLFSVMAWLAYLALRDVVSPRFAWLASCGLTLGYGLLLEVCQLFVPGRSPSLGDGVADGVGVLVAAFASYRIEARRRVSLL
jgi:hypothetical protein